MHSGYTNYIITNFFFKFKHSGYTNYITTYVFFKFKHSGYTNYITTYVFFIFSVKVNIGDLQSEENRDIVLELTIDSVNAPYDTTPQVLFNANVDYFNVVSNNLESVSESLGVLRPG